MGSKRSKNDLFIVLIVSLIVLTFTSILFILSKSLEASTIQKNLNIDSSSNQEKEDWEQITKIIAINYKNEVPPFPKKVTDYELTFQSAKEELSAGNDWKVPENEGINYEVLSCKPQFWIVRWRSQNPEVEVYVSTGIHSDGFTPLGEIKKGGAGIITGKSCVVPAFKFSNTLNGNNSTFTFVNYEYQIWDYSPDI